MHSVWYGRLYHTKVSYLKAKVRTFRKFSSENCFRVSVATFERLNRFLMHEERSISNQNCFPVNLSLVPAETMNSVKRLVCDYILAGNNGAHVFETLTTTSWRTSEAR